MSTLVEAWMGLERQRPRQQGGASTLKEG